jgi:hypothetical protein
VNRTFLLAGLAVAAVMAATLLYLNRGAHLVLEGTIQKVRVHSLDDHSALVIADFRASNPSDTLLVVQSVDVFVDGADGQTYDGATVAEAEVQRIMAAMPELGPKYNPSLIARDQIKPKESTDKMIAARFEIPGPKVESRKKLRIRIKDVDGAVSELEEGK